MQYCDCQHTEDTEDTEDIKVSDCQTEFSSPTQQTR